MIEITKNFVTDTEDGISRTRSSVKKELTKELPKFYVAPHFKDTYYFYCVLRKIHLTIHPKKHKMTRKRMEEIDDQIFSGHKINF